MKLFLTAAALMFSVAAYATPKVGDTSEFQLTVVNGADQMVGSYTMSIVSEAGDQMTLSTVIHFDGQADQVNQEAKKKSDLLNDETIAAVLANCAQYGGTSEQLVVLAGTFASCKIATQDDAHKENGFVWVAAAPFGIVKEISTSSEGMTYTLELKSSKNGQ